MIKVLAVLAFFTTSLHAAELPDLGTAPAITLTERSGAAFDTATLRGKIVVLDFIFTRCMGPCPMMSSHMQSIQRQLAAAPDVRLVSITTDPEHDTPAVLTEYAKKYEADPEKWLFLTGDKQKIIAFSRDAMKLAAGEDPSMHSSRFVVIDKMGKIRAYPDSQDANVREQVVQTVSQLRGGGTTISVAQAALLGLVEGITEYLPVSSTGHLVIADELLGLRDKDKLSTDQLDAVEAFEVVIQAGAILAVIALYGRRIRQMALGLVGRSPEGLRLLINITAAFIPTGVVGLLLNKIIKAYLQSTVPVIAALFVGGVVMIAFERTHWGKNSRAHGKGLDQLTVRQAITIGFVQCLAMWPGTSRSMVTILGGMTLGLTPVAAAEFSFLLGLPTLLAATGLKAVKEGHVLLEHVGPLSMAVGLGVAAVSAAFAVRTFVSYLSRRGFLPFGVYRIVVAVLMAIILGATSLA